MSNFNYEILEEIGQVSESSKGWTKELNLIINIGINEKLIYLQT